MSLPKRRRPRAGEIGGKMKEKTHIVCWKSGFGKSILFCILLGILIVVFINSSEYLSNDQHNLQIPTNNFSSCIIDYVSIDVSNSTILSYSITSNGNVVLKLNSSYINLRMPWPLGTWILSLQSSYNNLITSELLYIVKNHIPRSKIINIARGSRFSEVTNDYWLEGWYRKIQKNGNSTLVSGWGGGYLYDVDYMSISYDERVDTITNGMIYFNHNLLDYTQIKEIVKDIKKYLVCKETEFIMGLERQHQEAIETAKRIERWQLEYEAR